MSSGRAQRLINIIEATNEWTARWLSWIVVIMTLIICYEVLMRYFLNAPTDWASEINQYLMCAMSMLGGGYCLLVDQHVRVDFFYRTLSTRRQALVELCTWWLALLFCLVLIIKGGETAIDAFVKNKRSMSIMEYPLYPSMVTVPLGAILILLQIVARSMKNIMVLRARADQSDALASKLHHSKNLSD